MKALITIGLGILLNACTSAKHALKRLHRQGYDVPEDYHDPADTDFDKI